MFNNPFLKKDSLLEAVQSAMQDGEIRRQAEAFVNEQFGVYSRKAVVREHLADYDAALEEAYKCMKEGGQIDEIKVSTAWSYSAKKMEKERKGLLPGEGESTSKTELKNMKNAAERTDKDYYKKRGFKKVNEELAKKDYDKDGKIESPKDEVWGSRLRAAKMAGKLKEEEQIDELSRETKKSYVSKRGSQLSSMSYGPDKNNNTLTGRQQKNAVVGIKRAMKEGMADPNDPSYQGGGDVTSTPAKKAPASRMSMPTAPKTDSSVQGSGDVTKGGKPARVNEGRMPASVIKHKQKLAGMTDAEKKAKFAGKSEEELKSMARRHGYGKDSNEYSKHATSQKVDEAAYSAKAARAGKDIGKPGKQFSKIAKSAAKKYGSEERGKKVAGAILARIRAKHMKEEQIDEIVVQKSQMRPGETLGQTMNRLTGKTAVKGGANDPTSSKFKGPSTAPTPSDAAPLPPKKPEEMSIPRIDKGPAPGPASVPTQRANVPTPPPSSERPAAPAPAPQLGAPKSDASAGVKKLMSMNESVQVGANKYRIV